MRQALRCVSSTGSAFQQRKGEVWMRLYSNNDTNKIIIIIIIIRILIRLANGVKLNEDLVVAFRVKLQLEARVRSGGDVRD